MNTHKEPSPVPQVSARLAVASDGPDVSGLWIVEQGSRWIADCPNEVVARIIAGLLNEWFAKRPGDSNGS